MLGQERGLEEVRVRRGQNERNQNQREGAARQAANASDDDTTDQIRRHKSKDHVERVWVAANHVDGAELDPHAGSRAHRDRGEQIQKELRHFTFTLIDGLGSLKKAGKTGSEKNVEDTGHGPRNRTWSKK